MQYEKKQGLLISGDDARYTEPTGLGGAKSAMFEAWLISGTSLSTLTVTAEASNDRLNWSPLATSAATLELSATAPAYGKNANTNVIPYANVRLKLQFANAASKGLVDVAVRTHDAT